MTTTFETKRLRRRVARLLWCGIAALSCVGFLHAAPAPFGVPVRVSIKFILNGSGNRPASGSINTDEEVTAQFVRSSQIFSRFVSEIRLHEVEILEVSGQSGLYLNDASEASRNEIRNAAIASPAAFFWRNNAVNLYITGSGASAIADFPPNNNIVIMCQGSYDTTMAHELGHILNLAHTHEPCCGGDGCTDTLTDDGDWTKDQIANANYSLTYANCSVGQKFNVDMTYSNLMSYHDPDNRSMISPCQMDRQSTQVWDDRSFFLSKLPIYIQAGYGGAQAGSFTQPYATVQGAINAGVLNNRVMVLKTSSTHANPASSISTRTDVVTRRGLSVIQEKPPEYQLPYNLEDSKNPTVRAAILRVQASDKKKDAAGALAALLEAEKAATGREKHAIQLELAQRNRDASRFEESQKWFQKVADDTEQPGLRKHALRRAETMKEEAAKQKKKGAAVEQ